MMGVFAGLDALLDTPIEEILQQVVLGDDIQKAIQYGEGEYGNLLTTVDTFMKGEWSSLPDSISGPQLNQAYLDSLNWVRETMEKIG